MKIGIIGAGKIGSTLAKKLSQTGHEVKLANSRGPETIKHLVASTGATVVLSREAAEDVDVLILSVQLTNLPKIKPIITDLPASTVLIDTSNYYPFRDERVAELDQGVVESLWVSELLGRSVSKAWNAITAQSFAAKGKPPGSVNRLAIPVASDDPAAKSVVSELVDASGFDALDSGVLANSWRFQPGQPAFCTDLPYELLTMALSHANRELGSTLRDMLINVRTAFGEYTGDDLVYLSRAMTRSPGRFLI